jgi:hypothetical protein
VSAAGQSFIEVIRFAAANRLRVAIDYRNEQGQRSTRTVEPYSLRETQAGHIILHTHDTTKNDHRGFRVDRIEGARTTNETFAPRYAVELSPQGPVSIAPAAPRSQGFAPSRPTPAAPLRPRAASAVGLTYVFQCPVCQKKFNRSSNDPKLNAHKNSWGTPCTGRHGYLVDTKW